MRSRYGGKVCLIAIHILLSTARGDMIGDCNHERAWHWDPEPCTCVSIPFHGCSTYTEIWVKSYHSCPELGLLCEYPGKCTSKFPELVVVKIEFDCFYWIGCEMFGGGSGCLKEFQGDETLEYRDTWCGCAEITN